MGVHHQGRTCQNSVFWYTTQAGLISPQLGATKLLQHAQCTFGTLFSENFFLQDQRWLFVLFFALSVRAV